MASFKVIGISSSPRIKGQHCLYDSLSAIMLQGVMEKIGEQAEFATETIELYRHTIHSCRGCFSDMEPAATICVIALMTILKPLPKKSSPPMQSSLPLPPTCLACRAR
jgi:multimeric flavodoxin WrbA